MKPTIAGKLRHQITIQQPTRTQDSFGEPLLTWSAFAVTRASVEPIVGRELTQAAKVEGDMTHRVYVRFRDGITTDMRILHRGRVFNILSVGDVEERERRIEIRCKEEV